VGSGVRPVSRASGNRSSSVARVTGRATVHIPVRASPDPSLAVWSRAGTVPSGCHWSSECRRASCRDIVRDRDMSRRDAVDRAMRLIAGQCSRSISTGWSPLLFLKSLTIKSACRARGWSIRTRVASRFLTGRSSTARRSCGRCAQRMIRSWFAGRRAGYYRRAGSARDR